jgi:hypothetical protein
MMGTVAIGLCALLATMGALGFFLYRRFVAELRESHTSIYEALGRPGLVFYGSMRGQRLVHRFVREREYESLDDAGFVRLCRFYRAYVRVYGWLFAGACTALALAGLGIGVR